MSRAAALALGGLLLAAPTLGGDRPLAHVDGQPLTGEDLQASFASRHSGHLGFLAGEEEARLALEALIERTLLVHEAERLELGDDPAIRARVAALVERLAIEHLLDVEVREPARPSEEAIREAWQRYTGELVRVRQIVVPTRSEAEEIAELLAAGEAAERVARERSRVASRLDGGLLPPIGWGTMPALWDERVFPLELGETSAPFPSGGAWEIVQMVERLAVELPDFEEARKRLEGILLRRGLEERRRQLTRSLHERYKVVVELQPFTREVYAAAAALGADTRVAAWKGGELLIGEIAGRVDLSALERLTPEQERAELEHLVSSAVTEKLLPVEANARRYGELPEIRARARRAEEEEMLALLHNEFIFREVEVSDDEVRAWHESNPEASRTAERRRVSHILVSSEAEAEAARERLVAGAPFEELARELSQDSGSAPRGGDLGWISGGAAPPGFEVTFSLPEGGVSEPLRSDFGWHLVRVVEIEPPRQLDFDEVRERLRERLLRQRRGQRREQWLEQLRAAAEIEIDGAALRAFVEEPRAE